MPSRSFSFAPDLVPAVPALVWGRDESQAGEMWNSNSLISWLIVRSGLHVESMHPPAGGRAPGWRAGLVVARRQQRMADLVGREPAAETREFISSLQLGWQGEANDGVDAPTRLGRLLKGGSE